MGSDTIPARSGGQTITAQFFNLLRSVLGGDLVPRNSSGVAVANAGDLGSTTYPFKAANITVGYLTAGFIMPFHDFNGTVSPGQGWMKCDGTVVNQTNYDAIHGSGSWAAYITSSPLDGKNLPNLNNKYLVGANATSQDGSSAITGVGNSSHQINIAHSHTNDPHNHLWYQTSSGAGSSFTYNSSGTPTNMTATGTGGSGAYNIAGNGPGGSEPRNGAGTPAMYTNNHTVTMNSQLSSSQSIQPESIEAEFWIRII